MVLQNSDRWSNGMTAVTVSPKFQVVIPKEIRESMGIEAGQKVQMLIYQNRIELIPVQPMEKLRGFAKGIDTRIEREDDRVWTSLIHQPG